ncbi:MAG: hypothetical protein QXF09_01940 [Nitrososphaerota archaeon]
MNIFYIFSKKIIEIFKISKKNKSRIGTSPVVSNVILASTTLLIGFIMIGSTMNWSVTTSMEYKIATEKAIASQKSNMIIEHVQIINNKAYIYLYNIGKIPLRIVCVNIYKLGEAPPPPNYELKTFTDGKTLLDINEFKCLIEDIDSSLIGNSLVIRVYAIALTLFDPNNPGKNIEWGIKIDYFYNV